MSGRVARTSCVVVAGLSGLVAAGCSDGGPSARVPATLVAVSSTNLAGTAGLPLTGSLTVRVENSSGGALSGAAVTFEVTLGGGVTTPEIDTTGSNGEASAVWTLGAVAGSNQVTATVSGVSTGVVFTAVGAAGAAAGVTMEPQSLRLPVGTDSSRIVAQPVDKFGNAVPGSATYISRDPTLVSVDANGNIKVLRRHGTTYVVGTSGSSMDSALVVTLAVGDSPCYPTVSGVSLAVGAIVTTGFASDGSICVQGSPGSEFAVVPYFNSTTPSASIQINVEGTGIVVPGALGNVRPSTSAGRRQATPARLVPNDAFEQRLRLQEKKELQSRAAGARVWYQQQVAALGARLPAASGGVARSGSVSAQASVTAGIPGSVVPNVGDLWSLNVNAADYCSSPQMHGGRVAAVGTKSIVVADTLNPTGGFSTAQYQSIAATFDTLVFPLDTSNFGAPSDIDHNARVVLFFTAAVNDLSIAGSGSDVLGFFYSRDLLPMTGPLGNCPGSNVGEMFYLLVPDPTGHDGDPVSQQDVLAVTNGTVAHEFQHLINASRRMYINFAPVATEEVWLNEGLSHIAEELLFYRQSGTQPLQDLGTQIGVPAVATPFRNDQSNNFERYGTYVATPETQAPIGSDSEDADLPTRGAIWSFLRYAADLDAPTNESAFWFSLVNSQTSGVQNLDQVTGTDVYAMMHDWALSVFLDDLVPTVPQFQQPSWNFRQAWPLATSLPYSPHTIPLTDSQSQSIFMNAGGVAFVRFGIAAGQSALVQVNLNGQPLPSTMQLTLVRTK